MRSESVEFSNRAGETLRGHLHRPLLEPASFVLFAHCFTCTAASKAAVVIARELVREGFAVLRFDFTGLGESEGDFANTNFSSNLDDLVAAADYLRREHAAPQVLVGHSLGGAAVLAAAQRIPEARAVATIGAPSDTRHLGASLAEQAPELASQEETRVMLAGRSIRIQRQLLDDLSEQRLAPAVASLGRPLLIFHSPVDEVVGIEHAQRLFMAARHPRSFVSLDDADHLLSKQPADAEFVAAVLAGWASRYVETPELEAASRGEVVVAGGAAGFANDVVAGPHHLRADEPESSGGSDSGPGPYELLLAGLGACKSMTLRMYADRKGWPLEGVRVSLRHDRIHAQDCDECETREGRVDAIDVDIELAGPLDPEQRQRLLEIADRCPVHRTLRSEILIRTQPTS